MFMYTSQKITNIWSLSIQFNEHWTFINWKRAPYAQCFVHSFFFYPCAMLAGLESYFFLYLSHYETMWTIIPCYWAIFDRYDMVCDVVCARAVRQPANQPAKMLIAYNWMSDTMLVRRIRDILRHLAITIDPSIIHFVCNALRLFVCIFLLVYVFVVVVVVLSASTLLCIVWFTIG